MEQSGRPKFNLAIFLTFSRFLLVPIFIYYFLIDHFTTALIVLIIASITDVTDGLLARKFNMGTKLGSVLDPLADKFLMMISFIVLAAKEVLPAWLSFIVIGRDFYIVFGLLYIYFVRRIAIKEIKPSILSKRTTFAQFFLLAFSFVKVYFIKTKTNFDELSIQAVFYTQWSLIYITAILTITTFVQYTLVGLNMVKKGEIRTTTSD